MFQQADIVGRHALVVAIVIKPFNGREIGIRCNTDDRMGLNPGLLPDIENDRRFRCNRFGSNLPRKQQQYQCQMTGIIDQFKQSHHASIPVP